MARYEIAPLPRGYTIAPYAGRFYPLIIEMNEFPFIRMHTFSRSRNGTVSYAKRSLAVQFLQKYVAGETAGVKVGYSRIESETAR